MFEYYKDIDSKYEFLKPQYSDIYDIKKFIVSRLPQYNLEVIDSDNLSSELIIVVSKISYLAINSGKAILIITIANDEEKLIINTKIKQNFIAAVMSFYIFVTMVLFVSLIFIALFGFGIVSVVIAFILDVFLICFMYNVINQKDKNVTALEKFLYETICQLEAKF